MTAAERQARYRARIAERRPAVHYRRAADRRSRAQRWRDAVAELLTLQDEYASWLDNLPDSLAQSATSEKLRAIVDYDLTGLSDLEPPKGYGRD